MQNNRKATKVVVLMLLIGGIVYAGVDTWTTSGPWGGKAAFWFINAGTVYTELNGLYKSTDGGDTWTYSFNGIPRDFRAMWCRNSYSYAFPNVMYGGG